MFTIAGGIILAVLFLALVPVVLGGGIALVDVVRKKPVLLIALGIGVLFVGINILMWADRGPIRAVLAAGLVYSFYKLRRALERTR